MAPGVVEVEVEVGTESFVGVDPASSTISVDPESVCVCPLKVSARLVNWPFTAWESAMVDGTCLITPSAQLGTQLSARRVPCPSAPDTVQYAQVIPRPESTGAAESAVAAKRSSSLTENPSYLGVSVPTRSSSRGSRTS